MHGLNPNMQQYTDTPAAACDNAASGLAADRPRAWVFISGHR